jgi:hypothetical protein
MSDKLSNLDKSLIEFATAAIEMLLDNEAHATPAKLVSDLVRAAQGHKLLVPPAGLVPSLGLRVRLDERHRDVYGSEDC